MGLPIEIDVWQGPISELEVDAVVVPATETLFMTTGVATAVKRAAGEEVELAAIRQAPVAAGTAVVTDGGHLPAAHVIHAVAVGHDLRRDRERLRAAIHASLRLAAGLELDRVAFAPLGTERGVFPPEEAAPILIDAISEHARRSAHPSAAVVAVGATEWSAYRAALVGAATRA
ncbi:MAG TPA: macro domain-containing protein [Candidatus Limnocylindria bacterium]|nr:macro domain-containing protein [Candidatus Limnocylindria bacterium]